MSTEASVTYPAVCCRHCGEAVLSLDETYECRDGGVHVVTDKPDVNDERVVTGPHDEPGRYQRIIKVGKVRCRTCGNNLGNLQRLVSRRGEPQQSVKWYLKIAFGTEGVGVRASANDDVGRVRALVKTGPRFTPLVDERTFAGALAYLANEAPETTCPAHPRRRTSLSRTANNNSDLDELDNLLDRLGAASLEPF